MSGTKNRQRENVIRVGDMVEIVDPEFFVRCGYPKSVDDEARRIAIEHTGSIRELLRKCDCPDYTHLAGLKINRIAREIAHLSLRSYGYGGNTREIYTERNAERAGERYFVLRKKIVRTGKYYRSWGNGEDYEPGGLDNQACHVILTLSSFGLMIEAKRVRKVVPGDTAKGGAE